MKANRAIIAPPMIHIDDCFLSSMYNVASKPNTDANRNAWFSSRLSAGPGLGTEGIGPGSTTCCEVVTSGPGHAMTSGATASSITKKIPQKIVAVIR